MAIRALLFVAAGFLVWSEETDAGLTALAEDEGGGLREAAARARRDGGH